MDTSQHNVILAGLVALVVIVVAVGTYLFQQRQTLRLKRRFGTEYDAVVKRTGSRTKAEAELKRREKRVERMELVPLTQADANRFAQTWTRLQGSFVDDPKGVLIQADQLVR